MEIGVFHRSLNPMGGAEHVCFAVIEALKELNYKSTLVTMEPTNWSYIYKLNPKIVKPDKEISVLKVPIKFLGAYLKFYAYHMFERLRKKFDLTINTHGDILPVSADIVFMYYPVIFENKYLPEKYYESLLWKIYYQPYLLLQSVFPIKFECNLLLTFSEFGRSAIKKHLSTEVVLFHQPVDIDDFTKASFNNYRLNQVVLCGRYFPGKKYEFALDVARHLPYIEFIIIGSISNKGYESYYNKIAHLVKEYDLKNVKLLTNVSRETQIDIYSKSKVFMHTAVNEPFGIAVVEGMAAGLVPVVHKSGGPWLDIVKQGEYGLGFGSVNEAVESINIAIKNYPSLKIKAIERAKTFSKQKFIEAFKSLVLNLI
jgi:glycosyltransferase involved in cell wall biosynthesis